VGLFYAKHFKPMRLLLTFLFLVSLFKFSFAQDNFDPSPRADNGIRVMFYNVENLFDNKDDSLKRDDEFTPFGDRHWTYKKMMNKVSNIQKVVISVGGWEAPGIVGFCELENKYVFKKVAIFSDLKKYGYEILHKESPDRRGIDVGLMYRPEKYQPLKTEFLEVRFPFDTASRTRDILYTKGLVLNKDTLHIFVNHWPSRWGGQMATEPKRMHVASIIRKNVDSIQAVNPAAKIIVMGDLNDEPTDKSVAETLNAKTKKEELKEMDLFNLYAHYSREGKGTHCHKDQLGYHWNVLDQIIVSKALLDGKGLKVSEKGGLIFNAGFLLEDTEDGRKKPNRTFIGFRYHGGFSDHLPVYLDLVFE
jgi:hypothetical protein